MLKHSCKTFSLIGKIGKVILSSSMYKAASLNWLKQTLEWKCQKYAQQGKLKEGMCIFRVPFIQF